jgi:PAS domain S-box-containing protein
MTDDKRTLAKPPSLFPGVEAHEAAWLEAERWRLLIDSVRDYAIFMLDPQGRIMSWNPGAERIKGYHADEIIGQHFTRFYTPEDLLIGRPQAHLRRAAEEGRVEYEGWRVRKDGSLFWANVVLSAMRDGAGQLRGFAKVTRDLTERRMAEEQLRQSEERFRLMVEGVKDYAIFMLDPAGYVVTWNVGAERIKGYRAEEIIGQHFTRFYPEEDVRAGKCDLKLGGALREGRFEDEGWRVRKDGSRFWANVVITTIRDSLGQHVGFAKVTRDLTARRRQEQERLELAQAQEAIRLRDEFLSVASHELKTPLTSLQLQLQSVREQGDALGQRLVNRIERAARSAERLSDLIESLLDVSRISAGQFNLSPQRFDLSEAVRESAERLREAATRAGCQLIVRAEHETVGTWDRLRLEQVVSNLVSNAIKYAAQSPIEVSLGQREDTAVLQVQDRGPGIPEEALLRIFDRFERATDARHYGGLGLGLYVVREIVQAHGGKVAVHNLPEGGACFTVQLPLTSPPPTPAEPPQSEEPR